MFAVEYRFYILGLCYYLLTGPCMIFGDIDLSEIRREVESPCNIPIRGDRQPHQTCSELIDGGGRSLKLLFVNLRSVSKKVYKEYKKVFRIFCDITFDENQIPLETDASSICGDLQQYYAWMLWVQGVERHMDSSPTMRDIEFNITSIDKTVFYLNNTACYINYQGRVNNLNNMANRLSTDSQDPLDYRIPVCNVLSRFTAFSKKAASVFRRMGRKKNNRKKSKKTGDVSAISKGRETGTDTTPSYTTDKKTSISPKRTAAKRKGRKEHQGGRERKRRMNRRGRKSSGKRKRKNRRKGKGKKRSRRRRCRENKRRHTKRRGGNKNLDSGADNKKRESRGHNRRLCQFESRVRQTNVNTKSEDKENRKRNRKNKNKETKNRNRRSYEVHVTNNS